MFILNYQKLAEGEYKTDTNFRLAYQALMNNNASLINAMFIGAAQKPLGLGYIYHIFEIAHRRNYSIWSSFRTLHAQGNNQKHSKLRF